MGEPVCRPRCRMHQLLLVLHHGELNNPPVVLCRFNNNSQSPVTSVRQVAADGVNGVKVCSAVAWSRPADSDIAIRMDIGKPGSGWKILRDF